MTPCLIECLLWGFPASIGLTRGATHPGPEAAAAFARAASATLCRLYLTRNALRPRGGASIAAADLPGLKRLNLRGNPLVGDEGRLTPARSPDFPALECFELSRCGQTAAGVQAIVELSRIELGNTISITAAAIQPGREGTMSGCQSTNTATPDPFALQH